MHDLDGFTGSTFTFEGDTKEVFRAGSGPAVLVISEIPGITPSVAAFARRVVDIGCTAVMPSLFGTPGRDISMPYVLDSISRACISKEFATWAANKTSPATAWCKALARHEHAVCGGPGVGVVGMCLTGNFALAMMVDPVVAAPVLSQPSLPFPLTRAMRADVNLSPADLAAVMDLVRLFVGAFRSGPRVAERMEELRAAMLPQAVVVRTCGGTPQVMTVDTLITPRQQILSDGTLQDFSEQAGLGHVDVYGDIAAWFGEYSKQGVHAGMPANGRGMKSIQCVRTGEGWRISAVAWDDERDGVEHHSSDRFA